MRNRLQLDTPSNQFRLLQFKAGCDVSPTKVRRLGLLSLILAFGVVAIGPEFWGAIQSLAWADDSGGSSAVTGSTVHSAAIWPRFRGPNGRGEVDGLNPPRDWSSVACLWERELPGVGHSSPVIWGDRIFVTAAVQEDATQILRCYRRSDGTLLWERQYRSVFHRQHPFNCFASSTPALDAGRLFWAWASPEQLTLVALTQEDGQELWRRDLGPFVSQHGFGASPIVYGDMVILPNEQDGESWVIAVDVASGQTRWTSPRRSEKAAYATPCVLEIGSSPARLVLASWAHGLYCLDMETGQQLWEMPVLRYRVVASPVICAGTIFASCGEGGVGRQMFAFRLNPQGTSESPEIAYQVADAIPYVPTAVCRDRLIFLWSDRGIVSCLDAPTGKVLWRERAGGEFFASPIRIADQVCNISRRGEFVAVAALPKFHLIGQRKFEEGSHATPAVVDGVMYLRTFSRLYALDLKGGSAGTKTP